MINVASYAKAKSSGNGGTGGGSYSSTINYYGKLSPHYLWGNLFDGSQDITGDIDASQADITAKNVIVKNELDAKVADIIKAYVDYLYAKDIENEGNLSVSGDTSLKNTTITGTLDLNGSESISGGLTVSGDTSLKNTTVTDLLSNNITNNELIKTKDLLVTGSAHFFELIIDKIKAAGGAVILTPADGFSVDAVQEIEGGYRLFFRSDDENGNGIINMWKVNDQALCKSFNKAKVGTSYNVSNKNYWTLVTGVDAEPVKAVCSDGLEHDCHYIDISTSVFEGTVDPEVGDEIVMLGYRGTDDIQRQSAIYISAYQSIDKGLVAPLFAEYRGINDFNLERHRYSFIDANGATFIGTLKVTNGQTVEDYVSGQTTELKNEFKVDINGLTSRVSKMVNPNILPANSWKDQDDKDLFQKEDEEYVIGEPLSGSQNTRIATDETKDFLAYPPVMYLNKGNYTMSVYATAKYKPIVYGEKKDNLDKLISTETMINKNDVWHGEKRSQTTFHAPIDGYYQIGIKMMDSSYSGDTEYVDYDDPDNPSSGDTPSTGDTPSINTIQTTVRYTINMDIVGVGMEIQGVTQITPESYHGSVIYTTNNPEVATVDNNGKITTHSVGTAAITATVSESFYGGKHYLSSSDRLSLSVGTEIPTTTLFELDGEYDSFNVGDVIHTKVTVSPRMYDGNITYTSSDPSIATIDRNGVITILKEGVVTFKAKANELNKGSYKYLASEDELVVDTFKNHVYVDVTVVNIPSEIHIGDTHKLNVQVTPTEYQGIISYSSSNQEVLTIDNNGNLAAIGLGNATITIKANDYYTNDVYYHGKSVTYEFEVSEMRHEVEYFTIDIDNAQKDNLRVGQSYTLTRSVAPSEYESRTVNYKSSDDQIVTVQNNTITVVGNGNAKITGTIDSWRETGHYYEGATAEMDIIAYREITAQITSNLGNKYYVDDTVTVNATVGYEGYEGQIYISSSDENVATIENGVITFHRLGDVTITVSADTYTNGTIIVKPVTNTYTIRVKQKVQTVLVYEHKTGVLNAGSSVDLQVDVLPSDYAGVVHVTLSDNSLGTVTINGNKLPITAHLTTSTVNEGEFVVYAQAEEYETDYYLFLASEKEAIANYTNRIKEHVYVRGVPSDDKYYLYPNDTLTYNWTYTFHDERSNPYVPRVDFPSPVYTAGGLWYRNELDKTSQFPTAEEAGFDVSITSANNIYTAVIKPKGTHKVMNIAAKVNEQEDDYYIYHNIYATYSLAYIAAIDDLSCPERLEVPDWNIWYRTSNNRKITLKDDGSYTVTSHTYSNGLGKIVFKGNYGTRYVYIKILNQTNLTHIYFGNGFQYDGGIAGATNLQHIQLPNREGVSDMENQILEIGGNLRTIVYDDEWGGDASYFGLIFKNPYANSMVVTLFVPSNLVGVFNGGFFKVKPIDYGMIRHEVESFVIGLDNADKGNLRVGQSYTLTKSIAPTEYESRTVNYESYNKQIATVSNNTINVVGNGSTQIVATIEPWMESGHSYEGARAVLNISAYRIVSGVIKSNIGSKYYVGDTVKVNATVELPFFIYDKAYVGKTHIKSRDTSIATVENDIITFKKAGKVTIEISGDSYKDGTFIVSPITAYYDISVEQK